MMITEALIYGDGKAMLPEFNDYYYAGEETDSHSLVWFTYNGDIYHTVSYPQIIRTDWLPYNAEPEKCGACQEGDSIRIDSPGMADHLHKYHCQCRQEDSCAK